MIQRGTAWPSGSLSLGFGDPATAARAHVPVRAALLLVLLTFLGSLVFAQLPSDVPTGDGECRLDTSGFASGSRTFLEGGSTPIPISLRDGLLAAIRPHGADLFPLAGQAQLELGASTLGLTLEHLRRGVRATAVGPAAISRGDGIVAFVHD